jgi:hypothetical protein
MPLVTGLPGVYLKQGRGRKIVMEAPDLFKNIDPARISRSKAEETLLYVRYLLEREQAPAKARVYENLKAILEARLEELNERQVLPPLASGTRAISGDTDRPHAGTGQGGAG